MSKNQRRRYTTEFKQQAVELANEIGARRAEVKLGIANGSINNWKKSEAVGMPTKEENVLTLQGEVKKLKAELVEQKKVNTILKAAAAFFSQDHLK